MKKPAGFTLIETLIVCMLVCAFVLLPTVAVKGWQERLERRFFYYQLEKSILHTQQLAITDQANTRIELEPEAHRIVFLTERKTAPWQRLNIPKTIQLESVGAIKFKEKTGNVSTTQPGNIPKIVFMEERKIVYQFQLGSGRFEKK